MNHQQIIQLFILRRHKLYASLADPRKTSAVNPQPFILAFLTQLNAPIVSYSEVKHLIRSACSLESCFSKLLEHIFGLTLTRSGRFIAYVLYELCLQEAGLFPQIYAGIAGLLEEQTLSKEQIVLVLQMYLYGFPIPFELFFSRVFPQMERYLLEIYPLYNALFHSFAFFTSRMQRRIEEAVLAWLDSIHSRMKLEHAQLLRLSLQIKQCLISHQEQEELFSLYSTKLEQFEHRTCVFEQIVDLDSYSPMSAPSIMQLRQQCLFFKSDYHIPELYCVTGSLLKQIHPIAKNQILPLSEHAGYLSKLMEISSLEGSRECFLYFMEQMNVKRNRESLIEMVITEWHHYANICYLARVVAQICHHEALLKEYIDAKVAKICGVDDPKHKVNPKYIPIVCQFSKFQSVQDSTILKFLHKIIASQQTHYIKELFTVLESLGPIFYHRSLSTHTEVNRILSIIQQTIQNKAMHFSMDNLFHLRSLSNHLKYVEQKVTPIAQELYSELNQVRSNFGFALKKCQKMKREGELQKLCRYVCGSIETNDYVSVYYYASLLEELSWPELSLEVYACTLDNIKDRLNTDAQSAVKWSKFMGELLYYNLIPSHKLLQCLYLILNGAGTINQRVKCLCSCLEITKEVLLEQERRRTHRQTTIFLLNVKRCLALTPITNIGIHSEMAQILEFFSVESKEVEPLHIDLAVAYCQQYPSTNIDIQQVMSVLPSLPQKPTLKDLLNRLKQPDNAGKKQFVEKLSRSDAVGDAPKKKIKVLGKKRDGQTTSKEVTY